MNNGNPSRRRISRRDMLKLGAGAAAASAVSPFLAACGGQSTSNSKGPSGNSATGQVTLWTQQTDIYLQAQQHIVDKFNASHKVQAKVVAVPSASVTDVSKLLTAVRGGTGPDCYMLDRFTVPQQAATGTLEPLSQFVSKESDLPGQYLDYAWKEVVFKNKPYALPFDTDVRGLYYNKSMLRQIGINPSDLDISKGPITVDRMHDINVAANQTAANGNYTRVGVVPWFSQGLGYTWGFIFGGSFANLGKCQLTPTNHGVVQGYQFIYNWAKEFGPQKLASFVSAYAPLNAPPATDPFFVGRTALEFTGDWQIAAIQKYVPSLDYGITYQPVPKAGNKPSTWSGGFSLVIPQGAKNPEGAWELMRYMCGIEGQRYYTTNTSHLPTWKALVSNKSLFNAAHQIFVDHMLPITRSRPPLPVGAKYFDELQSALSAVELNSQQPAEALQAVGTAVSPQLQHYCPLT